MTWGCRLGVGIPARQEQRHRVGNVGARDRGRAVVRRDDDAEVLGHVVAFEEALERLESDEYWWCTECGAWVGYRRLRARPVTTLCILCKEKQEHRERAFA